MAVFGFVQLNAQDTNVDNHTLTVNIPKVALLDIEGGGAVTLSPDAPIEAGNPIDFSSDTDNSLWLNYSSIVGNAPNDSRTVTVSLTGTLPSGANLRVTAAAATGDGGGNKGTSSGLVTLAAINTDYTVITGIGSCYTGDGANKGHNLTYDLTENTGNYGDLNHNTDYTVTITYTLSDN